MNATALGIDLPQADRTLAFYRLSGRSSKDFVTGTFTSRVAYAAAHVVADPLAGDPISDPRIDFESTLAFRRYLWSLGFGIAEAMDTAQRSMGLTWALARELIDRSLREARSVGGSIACGINTDSLKRGLNAITNAYLEQLDFVESRGGTAIVMCSRELCSLARSAEDYERVYETVIAAAKRPVILHWLGPMFDPQLQGYWGSNDVNEARQTVLRIIARDPQKLDGIKISLLDSAFETAFRRDISPGVRVYTGDDFNYPELIAGDERGHSHALLGILAAIAPAANAALVALEHNERESYDRILAPTLPLARTIFEAPTYAYKAGIVFLAYLNARQSHFRMIAGLEGARSIVHYANVFRLADAAALLEDPERAVTRMKPLLALAGCA